jgi:hypothetical protein
MQTLTPLKDTEYNPQHARMHTGIRATSLRYLVHLDFVSGHESGRCL